MMSVMTFLKFEYDVLASAREIASTQQMVAILNNLESTEIAS